MKPVPTHILLGKFSFCLDEVDVRKVRKGEPLSKQALVHLAKQIDTFILREPENFSSEMKKHLSTTSVGNAYDMMPTIFRLTVPREKFTVAGLIVIEHISKVTETSRMLRDIGFAIIEKIARDFKQARVGVAEVPSQVVEGQITSVAA